MIYRLDNKGCCETTCIKNDPPLGLYFSIGLSAYISILVKPNYNIMDVEKRQIKTIFSSNSPSPQISLFGVTGMKSVVWFVHRILPQAVTLSDGHI